MLRVLRVLEEVEDHKVLKDLRDQVLQLVMGLLVGILVIVFQIFVQTFVIHVYIINK